ncbi:hypothetical protein QQF64_006417 [Cirrhinus molitorella]|uniref:Guanine nucleotide-binding protein subunit gamma n=1 Tax=Cirrhinus molitorella TaxID=172907 RepID=A0ABR3MF08_9TELE
MTPQSAECFGGAYVIPVTGRPADVTLSREASRASADGRRACLRCCGFFLVAFGWSRATRRSLSSDTLQDSIMKDGMANNSTASISQARKAVEQLKMEACMDRIKVSKAAADLMAYCDAHIREDPLIVPVPASENPFREKKFFCTIL